MFIIVDVVAVVFLFGISNREGWRRDLRLKSCWINCAFVNAVVLLLLLFFLLLLFHCSSFSIPFFRSFVLVPLIVVYSFGFCFLFSFGLNVAVFACLDIFIYLHQFFASRQVISNGASFFFFFSFRFSRIKLTIKR